MPEDETQGRGWIAPLIRKIRSAEANIKRLEERKPKAVETLRAAVQRDVNQLNAELYNGSPIISVEDDDQEDDYPADFIIHKDEFPSVTMYIALMPREYLIRFRLFTTADGGSYERRHEASFLKIIADKEGGIIYSKNQKRVTVDELARLLVEPVVIHGSGLKFEY